MDIVGGIILGTVQGLTEFLPVSSSGHLILAREVFGFDATDGLAVDAVLQLATILAVLIYFFRDLATLARTGARWAVRKPVAAGDRTLLFAVVLGTLPAVAFGLAIEPLMETAFRDARVVIVSLIAGSALFWYAERAARKREELTVRKGVAIGLFQTLALIPGVSRSGATISGGLLLGLPREYAAKFSFLLSFPVILGSGLKKLIDLGSAGTLAEIGLPLAVGFLTAFAVGIGAIHWLLRFLRTHSLMPFAVYRLALAAVAAMLLLV